MLEEFIRNAKTDRYNLMCFIDAHEKKNSSEHYYGIIDGELSNTITFNKRRISFTH